MELLFLQYFLKSLQPKCGSAPIIRFILEFFAMGGSLVFLGCIWRTLLRIDGGYINAILLIGIIIGAGIGVYFWNKDYYLG